MQEVSNKHSNVVMKPLAVLNYKQNLSRVDLQDQMLSYYPFFVHFFDDEYDKCSGKPS